MGDAFLGLRVGVGGSGLERVDDTEDLARSGTGHRSEEVAGAMTRDGHLDTRVDGAGVQSFLQREHAGGRGSIPGANRPLDGGGPPPPGQVREVQVDPSVGRHLQDGRRYEPTIGNDDADVGASVGDPLGDLGSLERTCFKEFEAEARR